MNKLKNAVVTIVTVGLGALVLTGLTPTSAEAGSATRVKVVNTPSVSIEKNLVSDGQAFSLPPNPNIGFEMYVPADVVMTDLLLTLNAPSLITSFFVQAQSTGATLVWEAVGSAGSTWAGNTSGRAALGFQSGLSDPIGLRIGVTCNNIGGNSCSGALMWSGYQP